MPARTPRRPRSGRWRRAWPGAVIGLGGLVVGVASVFSWLRVPTDSGGTTRVSGFGQATLSVPGRPDTTYDFNDLASGVVVFHPGWFPLVAGVLAVLLGIVAGAGRRARVRAVGAGLAAPSALAVGVFAVLRILQPDPLGVLDAGEALAGTGPWVALAGALVCLAGVASALFAGRDRPVPRRAGPV